MSVTKTDTEFESRILRKIESNRKWVQRGTESENGDADMLYVGELKAELEYIRDILNGCTTDAREKILAEAILEYFKSHQMRQADKAKQKGPGRVK